MTFTWRFEVPVGKVVELKFDDLDLAKDITDSRCIDTIEVNSFNCLFVKFLISCID